MPRPTNSEVDAYVFIKDNLKLLKWDIRNPLRNASGRVFTQAECLSDDEIKKCLVLDRPENIVKVTDSVLWIIEAKREHKQLAQAVKEAEDYAACINKVSKKYKALFISGVAGNAMDSFLIRTRYFDPKTKSFEDITINDKPISSLISQDIATMVLQGGYNIKDLPPIEDKLLFAKAEKINEILHLGAINKNDRARVMAALLLSLAGETQPNIDTQVCTVLIENINSLAKQILSDHNKEAFMEYIKIVAPPTKDNHVKFRAALVQTIQELNNLNIRSAMNSGTDILGKFYEVFLKYGNGAKEIGIVLTPRHIAQFAVRSMDVTYRDLIYDPTCGTGGFLVSAFDHVRKNSEEDQVVNFKTNNIFGVEQEAAVAALAIVNMIFRGDGKNNIQEGNCFQKNLTKNRDGKVVYGTIEPKKDELAITKVLMNPPFALKSSDEKEFKFIDQALMQLEFGGLLFSVLPYSTMVKPNAYLRWREGVLKQNTLLSVVTLPPDLFYPVGVHTVGIFILKGKPHPKEQNVLWIRALNDGLLKSKGKRMPNSKATDDYSNILPTVKAFLRNPAFSVKNNEMFQKATPIDFSDALLELVPENYLDQAPPNENEIAEGIEQIIRDAAAFLIHSKREDECIA